MKDKRNELFRSWDALTAKMYEVDRECQRLKSMKQQFDQERERARKEIDDNYREMIQRFTQIGVLKGGESVTKGAQEGVT